MDNYLETLSQVMNRLQAEGYNENINNNELNTLNADYWCIDNTYRFEGNSNPSDNSILFALSNVKTGKKALLVNAYSVYSNTELNEFISKLTMRRDLK